MEDNKNKDRLNQAVAGDINDQVQADASPILEPFNGEDPAGPVPGPLAPADAPEGGVRRNIWKYMIIAILVIGGLFVAVWAINKSDRNPEPQETSVQAPGDTNSPTP